MSTLPGPRRAARPSLRPRPERARRRGVEDPDHAVRRALQGLALLVGFPLAGSLVVLALLGADYLVLGRLLVHGSSASILSFDLLKILGPATFFVLIGLGLGVARALRPHRSRTAGAAVTASAEPDLWARVRQLAEAVGTRRPHRIRIGPDPVAEVSERSLLLGLVPGRRTLLVGSPLLAGLSERQFDAVIAHELAHFAHLDTRWGPVVARGRSAVLSALEFVGSHQRDDRPRARRFSVKSTGEGERFALVAVRSYARLFLTLTEAVSRRQEFAADLVSARIAGRRNAIDALSLLPVIEGCHALYRERFVQGGLAVGMVPTAAASGAGFAAMMSEPEYCAILERARRAMPEKERIGAYDSHPPLYDRVAALRALPDDGRPEDDWSARRALNLLRDPAGVLVAAELSAGQKKVPAGIALNDNKPVDWDTLVSTVARRRAAATAAPLTNAVASMRGVARPVPEDLLALVDAGRLGELLVWVTPGADRFGATAATASRRVPDQAAPMIRAWVLGALADRGTIGWRHSWSSFAALDAPAGMTRRIGRACAALLAENPDTAPLRGILEAGRTS